MRAAINVDKKKSVVSKKFDVRAPKYTRTRENSCSSTSSMSIIHIEKQSMGESSLSNNNEDLYSSK
jgi:hypothetical protein